MLTVWLSIVLNTGPLKQYFESPKRTRCFPGYNSRSSSTAGVNRKPEKGSNKRNQKCRRRRRSLKNLATMLVLCVRFGVSFTLVYHSIYSGKPRRKFFHPTDVGYTTIIFSFKYIHHTSISHSLMSISVLLTHT